MKHSLVSTLIALAIVGVFAVSAHADSITGTVTGDATLTPTATPGLYVANVRGEGVDAALGAFDFQGTTNIDFSSPPKVLLSDGSFTFMFSEGDLFATGSGSGMESGPGMATDSSELIITGGTGEFAGARGDVLLNQTITLAGPLTESLAGSYSGTVAATPEPCSFALLASGAAILFRRKRLAAPKSSI